MTPRALTSNILKNTNFSQKCFVGGKCSTIYQAVTTQHPKANNVNICPIR